MAAETGPAALSVQLLADRRDLIQVAGELRRREWGDEPGREQQSWWDDVTAREAEGRGRLPVTWVAVDAHGTVAGAVALGELDIAEHRGRSPWVLGMIVRPACRGRGVGRVLLARLEQSAAGQGWPRVWVATGEAAGGFYQRCGWAVTEYLPPGWGSR